VTIRPGQLHQVGSACTMYIYIYADVTGHIHINCYTPHRGTEFTFAVKAVDGNDNKYYWIKFAHFVRNIFSYFYNRWQKFEFPFLALLTFQVILYHRFNYYYVNCRKSLKSGDDSIFAFRKCTVSLSISYYELFK